MKVNKMLKISKKSNLEISKILVLLTGISYGYSSCSYDYNKLQNTNNIVINGNSHINNITYNITNNLSNNTNNNLVNNIINNNIHVKNVTYNITNNLNNINLNNNEAKTICSDENNINKQPNNFGEQQDLKKNDFMLRKRKRTDNNTNNTQANNKEINNNQNEDYEYLFGKNYNEDYYYEKASKYINNTETIASGDNKYINNTYKIFTTFVNNLKYVTYNYKCDNNDVCISLRELKRYEILCDRFKFVSNRKWNNGLSRLNKYIKKQTKSTISVEELYNYIFNKIGILYDKTINALIKSPLEKQEEIIEDSIRILGYIATSLTNTEIYKNDSYNDELYDELYDEDMLSVALDQLVINIDKKVKCFELNLNKNFNNYHNKLMLFLDEVTKISENKNIIINGIQNTQVKRHVNELLEKLLIKNENNYKEIKEFFTKDSWNLKTREYFELFKKHSSNLKNIICKKENNWSYNSFYNTIYPYYTIINKSLKDIMINNGLMYDRLNAYYFVKTKLGVSLFL